MTQIGRISFAPFYNHTVGFDNILSELDKYLNSSMPRGSLVNDTFPPHNIRRIEENKYVVELAVAGFKKEQIEISIQNGVLTIKGNKEQTESDDVKNDYVYKGISTRSFLKRISLAETVEVRGAQLKDGILFVGLENVIPETKRPRIIEITDKLSFDNKQLLSE